MIDKVQLLFEMLFSLHVRLGRLFPWRPAGRLWDSVESAASLAPSFFFFLFKIISPWLTRYLPPLVNVEQESFPGLRIIKNT